MDDFDDKTQRWLLKTQEIRRTPAMRAGGVPIDHRARRLTALSLITAAALVIALVIVQPKLGLLLHRSSPIVPRELSETPPTERPAASTVPASQAVPALPYIDPADTPPSTTLSMPPVYIPTTGALTNDLRPAPGHVAPPAPVWLESAPPPGAQIPNALDSASTLRRMTTVPGGQR